MPAAVLFYWMGTHGIAYGDQLLLDFHSYPLRLKFTAEENAIIDKHFYDSIYNKSMGGITPNAWETGSLPNVGVFDHGYSLGSRAANTSPQFGDGFDEIIWFSRLPQARRDAMLAYLYSEVRKIDSHGHLSMPGMSLI